MKKRNHWFSRILSMAIVSVLVLCLVAVPVLAAGPVNLLTACLAINANEETESAAFGIPVLDGDDYYMFTDPSVYVGDTCSYVGMTLAGDAAAELTPVGLTSSLLMCSFTDGIDSSSCYPTDYASVGQQATLVGLTIQSDTIVERRYPATITGYNSQPDEELDWYELEVDTDFSGSDVMLPAAFVTDDNCIIGIAVYDNGIKILAFAEPTGGAGAAPANPDPTDAPDPTEAPDSGSAPSRPTPEQDAPDETPAAQTTPASTPTASVDDGTDTQGERNLMPGLLIGGGVVVVAVAVAVILITKKKSAAPQMQPWEQNVPAVPDINQTMPVPETPPAPVAPVGGDGWEPVSNQQVQTVYISVTGGPLLGQEYPMNGQSILIGRAAEANIRYPADTSGVSRRHCKIMLQGGAMMIMDLGSTSGTFLKGHGQLAPNAPVPLKEGDVFYLGSKQNSLRISVKPYMG